MDMQDVQHIDLDQFHIDRSRFMRVLNVPKYENSIECRRDYAAVDRIIANWERLAKNIATEAVICRRNRKITDKYRKMVREFHEHQAEIEQAITMYVMLHG